MPRRTQRRIMQLGVLSLGIVLLQWTKRRIAYDLTGFTPSTLHPSTFFEALSRREQPGYPRLAGVVLGSITAVACSVIATRSSFLHRPRLRRARCGTLMAAHNRNCHTCPLRTDACPTNAAPEPGQEAAVDPKDVFSSDSAIATAAMISSMKATCEHPDRKDPYLCGDCPRNAPVGGGGGGGGGDGCCIS
eukprot:TRINITY_DN63123_c0_g1_i1.p1 TRINITY_DN63123_c0_g1~~TRINITY_DN63123_c0_g1_i1.p1  ORF type:complete len:190 (+),score=21.14 TRINITY_DN63123_c0_g1_i1:29-598(+)